MLSNRSKGILAIIVSAFGFALMGFFVRLADDFGGPVSSFQKSLFRNLVALVVAAVAYARARPHSPPRPSLLAAWLLLSRSVLGTIGIFANFYALGRVPIAEAQTLNKTAPFFTVLFAWLFLSERIGLRQILTLSLAFVGALFVAKPGFAGAVAFPLAIGLMSGVCAGGAYACVRGLRRLEVSPALIILFFSGFSSLAALPFIIGHYDPMTLAQIVILSGAGLGAAVGQFGVTLAYGFAAPNEIAVFDYTSVLFSAALGFVFFAQLPDVWSIVGFVAILFAASRLSLSTSKPSRIGRCPLAAEGDSQAP